MMSSAGLQRKPTAAIQGASHKPRPQGQGAAGGGAFRRCQRALGNQAFQHLIQAKLKVGAPNDRFEREADRVADQVMRMPLPGSAGLTGAPQGIQRSCAACGGGGAPCSQCGGETDEIQRKPLASTITQLAQRRGLAEERVIQTKAVPGQGARLGGTVASSFAAQPVGRGLAPAPVAKQIMDSRGTGRPLPGDLKSSMEDRFGADFGAVRIHTGPRAAALSHALTAKAFTVGQDVFFGAGRFAPASPSGRFLMAHELTHTLQQKRAGQGNAIQRDGEAADPITANDILPFAQDSQIQIDHLLNDTLLGLLRGVDPATATTLELVSGQRATVTSATADLVELRVNQQELNLPQGNFRDVRVRLRRNASGAFDFEIVGETGTPPAPTDIFAQRGLTATRSDSAVVLSSGSGASSVPLLRVSGSAESGVNLAVLKESFIDQVPGIARGLVPDRIEALRLSALPPASAGRATVERAASELTRRASARRQTPRQQVNLGAGVQFGSQARFLLQGSWQYNFQPVRTAGSFFQVPLQVSIQYAPSSAVLGRLSAGVGTSLSAIDIPVNLRVMIGGAGGQVLGPEVAGARPLVPAAGVTLGGGLGVELGRWRINLDYDHLFNLVPGTDVPGIDSLTLGGGIAF